jgi:PAS domain-containing protein
MRLPDFIFENIEAILQAWEEFAAAMIPPSHKMDQALLRDHAKQMLETIAADIAAPAPEQSENAKAHGPPQITAAMRHGAERLGLGFSLPAAISEYRALRASVTRLWEAMHVNKTLPGTAIADFIRFNEAIDQAISESAMSYSFEKDHQTRVFDTILSSSPDLSFTFDLDGKFTFANKSLTELF